MTDLKSLGGWSREFPAFQSNIFRMVPMCIFLRLDKKKKRYRQLGSTSTTAPKGAQPHLCSTPFI